MIIGFSDFEFECNIFNWDEKSISNTKNLVVSCLNCGISF